MFAKLSFSVVLSLIEKNHYDYSRKSNSQISLLVILRSVKCFQRFEALIFLCFIIRYHLLKKIIEQISNQFSIQSSNIY